MKILIVNFEYPPLGGGGGLATQQIAQELAQRHEVHIVTSHFGVLPRTQRLPGISIHRVPVIGRRSLPTASLLSLITFAPAALWRGLILCREQRFDVINAQFVIPSGIPACLLARIFHIPLVISFIGGDIFDPSKGISPHRYSVLRFLIRWLAGAAVLRTAISEDTKRRARDLHGVSGDIIVTHLGVTPNAQQKKMGAEPYFVSVGRLIPRKCYHVLLEAWREIEIPLVIVGDGPLENELIEEISVKGLIGRVKVAGQMGEERKWELLRGAMGYVSAAEHEGFGIVFLEAMEAGLPIVATDTGGQTDFLMNEEHALLVPVRNVLALRAAVQRLINDKSLRQRLGAVNRRRVHDFYIAKTTKKFEEVLERAVKIYESSR